MSSAPGPWDEEQDPTATDLAEIEREMPLIEAEIALLDAEIATIDRPVTELDRRRIRRAQVRVLAELLRLREAAAIDGPEAA
ncbi:MAG: hypothetical protein GEV11_15655 [Streptosporangiales bacterium]|nr:hypothetical protein [Streptosporangiales bacterium]